MQYGNPSYEILARCLQLLDQYNRKIKKEESDETKVNDSRTLRQNVASIMLPTYPLCKYF